MKISNIIKYIFVIIALIFSIYSAYYAGNTLYNMHLDIAHDVSITQLSNHAERRQMMGYVIKTKNNIIVLDGGLKEDTENLINYINTYGNGKVDAWFLSHPHQDHVEAFLEIVKNTDIQIDKVYVTLNPLEWDLQYDSARAEEFEAFFDIINNSRIKDNVEEVELNQTIIIDNLVCEILGVKNPEIHELGVNNSSMIVKFSANGKSFLFLGDSGKESGQKLLDTQGNKVKADIVQMAHHGQNGVDKNVYEAISPTICLWPTTDWLWNNDIGTGYNSGIWKTLETRQWIEDLGVTQNYIEKDGDTTLNITKDGIFKLEIEQEKSYSK